MNLGRYEIVRELGKGAMGVVYLGKDPLIGRLVALKTIRVSAMEDEETREFRERFLREAQAAGLLSHPSIVTVHDIGQDDASGMSYIAMEYVEGPNLKELIQQSKLLGHAEIAEALAQVADALDYAHSKGIIHRDVKPANIILCDSRVKITDFGIAKIASSVANLTSTGQFLGTPNYMAPEQIKGGGVDGRTDIFSLGIVLYEALTRRKPFGGDSLTTISYKIVHDTFLPLREADPTIPEAFETIVARCLEKEPAKRYQRGRELAVDLRNAVRPAGAPPIELEETWVSEENGRIPTLEVPFPEASHGAEGAGKRSGSLRPRSRLDAAPAVLRQRVPPALFLGVPALLLLVFGATAFGLWQRRVEVPRVDTKREAQVARERTLREQARQHLAAGNVEAAYQSYLELQKLAPESPAVRETLSKLERVRTQTQNAQQRIAASDAKFEEGRKLFEKKQYARAIPFFETAFTLNPNSEEAVNYMRMSRELLAVQKLGSTPEVTGGIFTGQSPVPAGSRRAPTVQVTVRSPKAQDPDAYVFIRAGNQTLMYANLWEEKQTSSGRRREARDITTTRPVPAGKVSIFISLAAPSIGVKNASTTITQTFEPGRSYTMVVRLDRSKKLDVRFARV